MAESSSIDAKEVELSARAKRSIKVRRSWIIIKVNVNDGELIAINKQ